MASDKDSKSVTTPAFWQQKSLEQMSPEEWESLCDGCAKCCLHKLEDIDTGELAFTNVACGLLDIGGCRCRDYKRRSTLVPDCVTLTPRNVAELAWMPSTCAYRLLAEGKPLAHWHPLVSGDPDSVHRAGISVRGRCISERHAGPLEHHVLDHEP
ncbi:MAG: YcgN family cysteine cluster protein [Alphaproteobacteria bacterium]|nr:YcgN family cysteine cluster protein [Alphaproteobacteria bacterium]MBL6952565.1 YcgN family cysteine cluster protein [Alphaproteobacteria bacterium]